MALFRECLKHADAAVKSLGLRRLPVEVVLPGLVPYSLVPLLQGRSPFDQHDVKLTMANELMANSIHVWAAYREAKTIYRVERSLTSCFAHTFWPEAAPTEALRPPSRCTIVELSSDNGPSYYAAVYDLATAAETSGHLELRLSALVRADRPILDESGAPFSEFNNRWVPICILRLSENNLGSCLTASARAIQRYGASPAFTGDWRNPTTTAVINTLLYLAGEPDLVRLVHPGEKPTVKAKLARADPERFKDLREPNLQAVGTAFARAIERWEIEHANERGDPTGRTVRPHMRRAHAHLYWTGEGRTSPRVRFLLPVSVKGGMLVEEPETPRVSAVR